MGFISYIKGLARNKNIKFGKGFKVVNVTPTYSDLSSDKEKLSAIFTNPAVLKVFALQCDLFSLAEVKVINKSSKKEIENDPFLKLLKNPNPLQSKRQFLWDYMFWNMMGNSVLHVNSSNPGRNNNTMYFLDTSRIMFPSKLESKLNRIFLSKKAIDELLENKIEYINDNRHSNYFKLKDLIFISDLTNSTGNWFKGNSRMDALYKIIGNSEAGIDSKNINARYLGKYIVSGQTDDIQVNNFMMQDEEKTDIETKIDGEKKIHAVTTPVDIKRFIERSDVLESLDKSYLADYYKVGKLYGIPRDVLEAYESSTYENQEKGRGSHVSYTLSPKGEDLSTKLDTKFGYTEKEIQLSWEHLPFMQVFKKDKAEVNEKNAKSLEKLMKAGATFESACKILELDLEK